MTWLVRSCALLAAPLLVLITAGSASAAVDCAAAGTWCSSGYTPSGSSVSDSAAATFTISSGTLTLVVTNTSTFTNAAYVNADVLTGVFVDIKSDPGLTGVSAITPALVNPSSTGSSPIDISADWGWQHSSGGYAFTAGGTLTSAHYGIAAAGYGLLSPSFGNTTLQNWGSVTPSNLGKVNYGIVGSNFATVGIKGNSASPLAADYVTFTFSGLPSNATIADIGNVMFTYGTNPDGSTGATTTTGGGGGTPVPEPASLGVLALGLLGLAGVRARRAW